MALLQYGLPQVSSACVRAEEVGWMAVLKNQILPVVAFKAEPYYKRTMVSS